MQSQTGFASGCGSPLLWPLLLKLEPAPVAVQPLLCSAELEGTSLTPGMAQIGQRMRGRDEESRVCLFRFTGAAATVAVGARLPSRRQTPVVCRIDVDLFSSHGSIHCWGGWKDSSECECNRLGRNR